MRAPARRLRTRSSTDTSISVRPSRFARIGSAAGDRVRPRSSYRIPTPTVLRETIRSTSAALRGKRSSSDRRWVRRRVFGLGTGYAFSPVLAIDPNAQATMARFVAAISVYAKAKKPGFTIVAQNAIELANDSRYLGAVDAVLQEDLFFANSAAQAGDIVQSPAITSQLLAEFTLMGTRRPIRVHEQRELSSTSGCVRSRRSHRSRQIKSVTHAGKPPRANGTRSYDSIARRSLPSRRCAKRTQEESHPILHR